MDWLDMVCSLYWDYSRLGLHCKCLLFTLIRYLRSYSHSGRILHHCTWVDRNSGLVSPNSVILLRFVTEPTCV
jgi:hypothetical protein